MRPIRIIAGLGLAALLATTDIEWTTSGPQVALLGAPVIARMGHPLTPMSAAGVARRNVRRAVVLSTLPAGCVLGNYYGGRYYRCGGSYYRRSGDGYEQVDVGN